MFKKQMTTTPSKIGNDRNSCRKQFQRKTSTNIKFTKQSNKIHIEIPSIGVSLHDFNLYHWNSLLSKM
jgi:hypothetical protein